MGASLENLPRALLLSRFARSIIRQNLVIALGVIAIVAPLGALGIANLAIAVFLHEGSTIVVVLNSLRLLRFRTP
jgi:Cd2+/Zn2+-exporting ATPase